MGKNYKRQNRKRTYEISTTGMEKLSSPSDRQKFFEPVDEGTRRFEIAVDLAAQYLYQLKELEEVINKQKEEIRALKEEKRIAILQNSEPFPSLIPLAIPSTVPFGDTSISIFYLFDQLGTGNLVMKSFCQLLSMRDVLNLAMTCKYFHRRIMGRSNGQQSVLSLLVVHQISTCLVQLGKNSYNFDALLYQFFQNRWRNTDKLRNIITQNHNFTLKWMMSSFQISNENSNTATPQLGRTAAQRNENSNTATPQFGRTAAQRNGKTSINANGVDKLANLSNFKSQILQSIDQFCTNATIKGHVKATQETEVSSMELLEGEYSEEGPAKKKRNRKSNKRQAQERNIGGGKSSSDRKTLVRVEDISDSLSSLPISSHKPPVSILNNTTTFITTKFANIVRHIGTYFQKSNEQQIPEEKKTQQKIINKRNNSFRKRSIQADVDLKRDIEALLFFNQKNRNLGLQSDLTLEQRSVFKLVLERENGFIFSGITSIHKFRTVCRYFASIVIDLNLYQIVIWNTWKNSSNSSIIRDPTKTANAREMLHISHKIILPSRGVCHYALTNLILNDLDKKLKIHPSLSIKLETRHFCSPNSSLEEIRDCLFRPKITEDIHALMRNINLLIKKGSDQLINITQDCARAFPRSKIDFVHFIDEFYEIESGKVRINFKIPESSKDKINISEKSESIDMRSQLLLNKIELLFIRNPREQVSTTELDSFYRTISSPHRLNGHFSRFVDRVCMVDIQNIAWKWIPAALLTFNIEKTLFIAFCTTRDPLPIYEMPPWINIEFCRGEDFEKNDQAVDFNICMRTYWLHQLLPLEIKFYILSRDAGFRQLKRSLDSDREIEVLSRRMEI